MRIALVHCNSKDVGGSDTVLYQMARAMRDAGFDVRIVLSQSSSAVERYRALGIDVTLLSMPRLSKSLNPLKCGAWMIQAVASTIRLMRWLRRSKTDLVFANDYNELPALWAAAALGIPRMVVLRFFFDAPRMIRTSYIGLLARASSAVVCVSEAVRQFNFDGLSARLRGKAVVLYDWCDGPPRGVTRAGGDDDACERPQAVFERFGIPADARVVLMPSRIEPWKGQHVLVEAAAQVLEHVDDVYFLFVGAVVAGRGREAYCQRLLDRARELKIEDRVIVGGFTADVAELMRQAAVVAHCSVTPEPFGMTLVEAFYCGVPVVASAAGGPLEIVGDTRAAMLHEPGNSDALARSLARLLTDRSLAAHVAAEAWARREFFQRDRRWPEYERLVRWLAAGRDLNQFEAAREREPILPPPCVAEPMLDQVGTH